MSGMLVSHVTDPGEQKVIHMDDEFCIYCFASIPTAIRREPGAAENSVHSCPERLLASQPAAPPPFN